MSEISVEHVRDMMVYGASVPRTPPVSIRIFIEHDKLGARLAFGVVAIQGETVHYAGPSYRVPFEYSYRALRLLRAAAENASVQITRELVRACIVATWMDHGAPSVEDAALAAGLAGVIGQSEFDRLRNMPIDQMPTRVRVMAPTCR